MHMNGITKLVVDLAEALIEDSSERVLPTEERPFDQARDHILRIMFLLMAAQRELLPKVTIKQLWRAKGRDLLKILADWEPGWQVYHYPDVSYSAKLDQSLTQIALVAQKELWPSEWLGSLLDGVDVYSYLHHEDSVRVHYARRQGGAYYTHQRLVRSVVQETLQPILDKKTTSKDLLLLKVIDPAVGGASFLVEALHQLAQTLQQRNGKSLAACRRQVLDHCMYGVDIDPLAVAAARYTLWLEAAGGEKATLEQHIVTGDSLLGDTPPGVDIFDVVLGNPPWNKIKADLKEFYAHYDPAVLDMQGSSLKQYVHAKFIQRPSLQRQWEEHQREVKAYAQQLFSLGKYSYQDIHDNGRKIGGDPDLYKFFLERSYQLTCPEGRIGLVLPAALCTAEGALGLRRMLLAQTRIEALVTLENKDRLFPIDTRFKYLILVAEKGQGPTTMLPSRFMLSSVEEATKCLANKDLIPIPTSTITTISPYNLTFADVRDQREVSLLERLHQRFPTLGTDLPHSWNVHFVRELDMTNDSNLFIERTRLPTKRGTRKIAGYQNDEHSLIPLFEGRMIHQFDNAFKAHVSGHGRKATWKELSWSQKQITPHYYVEDKVAARISGFGKLRVGYCDVTGQTNERTILAALLPGRCVAGNKVPTLRFAAPYEDDLRICLLWLAIANSFVVDWLMRMRMSTTINFFHWHQIPFPRLLPTDPIAEELISAAARLSSTGIEEQALAHVTTSRSWEKWIAATPASHVADEPWIRQYIRANLDAKVAGLFGLSVSDYAYILTTFPLLDRAQPALPGDFGPDDKPRSYITRDLALLTYFLQIGEEPPENIVDFYQSIGFDLRHIHTSLYNLSERVERGLAIGATAYVPTGVKYAQH